MRPQQVILRLEESDDRQKLSRRLSHWMEARRSCEQCLSALYYTVYQREEAALALDGGPRGETALGSSAAQGSECFA
eukprot:2403759-Rhodomonas_salina.4